MLSLCLFVCAAEPVGRGEEWRSWSSEQRTAYVYGFIDGHLEATSSFCLIADELFEGGEPHTLGDGSHPSDMPSARCLARRGEFSNMKFDKGGQLDVSAYTDVITAFYEKHTDCRDYPFGFLLEALGLKYATADQLYEMALKGLLKGRSREWCGIDGTPAVKPMAVRNRRSHYLSKW